jgi:uncharacterized membrane protein YdcZ (DUF606 family)
MLCPKCSQPVADGARFCGSCGEPMSAAPASPAGPGTAAPRLIDRIKNIILSPKTEWPVIETEPTTIAQLYKGYVIPLVAFSALMSFVRLSIVGIGFWRMPVLTGLAYALVSFVFGLLGLYVFGWLIDMLAPAFSGQRDRRQAVKTAAYAFTPGAIGAVFVLLGGLGRPLHLVAAIWGIYLLYLGLPVLMRSPREKATAYTAAVIVCAILLFAVFGIIFAVVNPMRSYNPFGMKGTAMTREERQTRGAGPWEPTSPGLSVEYSTNPHQQLTRGSHARRRASSDLAVQYFEAAPHGSVERGGERCISGEEGRDCFARQLENLAMGACGGSGRMRGSREQADFADILPGADTTEGLDRGRRPSGELQHTRGNHVERRVVRAFREERFPRLQLPRLGLAGDLANLFGLQILEQHQVA